ncbi:tetratricopeptide repeat-containing sensor histidine kinase [Pedobacter sp. ASV28]|uniref:tetratricopeptide repeat-containing sensor histidine kinase n=1 Tax=Pedobacter sp. ASV28 TaxID=2795123 RepID=UPI0018ED3D5B|nr:tetratricopeptide repeat-containing sensor histidine kinase [Pedobacter sp. ASV28]
MKILLSLMFFLCAYANFVWSQGSHPQKKIDSLLELNNKYKLEDSLKLTRYYQLYRNYMKLTNTPEVDQYVDKTIQLAKKLNKPSFIAEAYYRMGFYHHIHSRYFLAEEYYGKSLDKYTELNDKEWLGGIYQNLSAMYVNIPDYSKALDANFKAVDIFSKIKDVESVAGCYVNISSIYSGLEQHYDAIQYLDKALKIFLNSKGNEYGIALCYANLGDVYFEAREGELNKIPLSKTEKYKKSLGYLEQSLKYAEKIEDNFSLLASINQTKGNIYKATGKKDLAEECYQKSIEYYAKTSVKKEYAVSLLALANFYIGEVQYAKAEPLLSEVIEIGNQNKILSLQRDGYMALTLLSEQQGKYNDALKYFKAYIQFKEQIFNEEKEKEITRKQMQLDFSIKERDYQNKQQLTDLALEKQVLLVKKRQQELLLNQQQLALSDKEKNIQRLNFLQQQANLEKEKLQKESQLKQQKLISSLEKEQANQQILQQENKIKLNRNFSIFFGVLAVVLLAAAIVVYKAQRKTAKLNELVLAQKEQLENLGKVKDRIFSVVSHDMRAPVNSLLSFMQLLEMGNVSSEKLKKYATDLKSSLGYTSSMLENLLNWAYSQMQGFKPTLQPTQINQLLEELLGSARVVATKKSIDISCHAESGMVVMADEDMLSLIIRNVLSNAIKFTEDCGAIMIYVEEHEKNVSIQIADNGVGMDIEQIQSFNKTAGYQLGETTLGTQKEKGTGLGLTLCKTFAKMMNATLTVKPNVDKGTVFMLVLPKS